MKTTSPKKIHIIGSVGSGKTTFARKLSEKLEIPHYELDNVVWIRSDSGDVRRSDEDRDKVFNQIIHSESWIIEGASFHEWVIPSFDKADVILFLDTNYSKRKYRITKRFILQNLGFEKANYKPTFNMFKKMFEWNANFENIHKHELLKTLIKYEGKSMILKDNNEVNRTLNNWSNLRNKEKRDNPII